MKLANYRIDTAGFDWPLLLKHWHWLIAGSWTVWCMNRFGDLFLHQSGPVYRVSLDDGSLSILADSKDDFARKLDCDENASDWLLIPLVDKLVASEKVLRTGQCYGFLQLPIFGGDYTVENVAIREIAFQYAALGPIFEKLKDIPDGTSISFELSE